MKRKLPIVHLYIDHDGAINPLELSSYKLPGNEYIRAREYLKNEMGVDEIELWLLYVNGYRELIESERWENRWPFYHIDQQVGDLVWSSELIDDLVALAKDYHIEWNWLASNYSQIDKINTTVCNNRLPCVTPLHTAEPITASKLNVILQELDQIERLGDHREGHIIIWIDHSYYSPFCIDLVNQKTANHRSQLLRISPCPVTGLNRKDIATIRAFIEDDSQENRWL